MIKVDLKGSEKEFESGVSVAEVFISPHVPQK